MDPNYAVYNDERLNALWDELEEMKIELTKEEEQALAEIAKHKEKLKDHNLLKDIGDTALKGVQDYLDSFIDTSEIVNDWKNPGAVRNRNDSQVKFRQPDGSLNPGRTLEEAKKDPYPATAKRDNTAMSEKGRQRLAYYEEVYKQRTKTVSDHSNDLGGRLSKNEVTLAGIESFQFGPKVDLYTPDEYKRMYQENQEKGNQYGPTGFIRKVNYDKFYSEKYAEFGFPNKTQFASWCRDNNLTIHESPDGMYLVPTDVHATESHTGEVSKLQQYLSGEITKKDLAKFEKETRMAKVKYETATRATRAGKAVGMSAVKTLVMKVSTIVVTETYFVFSSKEGEDKRSFTEKMSDLVKNCAAKMKEQVKPTFNKIVHGAIGNVGMEILTALNDFVFKTAKNIFKVIRAMIGSIIRALKVLVGKEYTWEEKVFEALKILSAGVVAALGFSLNEFITGLLTSTGVPPLVVIAPYVGDVLAGLLASILSGLVLMLFDSYKERIEAKSAENAIAIREMQISGYHLALAGIEQAQTTIQVAKTAQFVVQAVSGMAENARAADENLAATGQTLEQAESSANSRKSLLEKTSAQSAQNSIMIDDLLKNSKEQ